MPITKSINEYYKGLDDLQGAGGLFVERDTERLFANLLAQVSKESNYFIRCDSLYTTDSNTQIRFDTGVYTGVGIVYGVHEAKKHDVDLNKAIEEKKEARYPFHNIIFENSQQAVLFQDGEQYNSFVEIRDKQAFTKLIERFFSYTSREIQEYNASQQAFFKQVPELIKRIREFFDKARKHDQYKENIIRFEDLLKETINPNISRFETREIIVQHFLTIDIFSSVFSEFSFDKYNPIARELEQTTRKIFYQSLEKYFLRNIHQYLEVVKKTAVNITDFGIKKQFLIHFYEQFYKAYNPKAADRLGVVYTPEPVVKFMVANTDRLLKKHFDKNLSDEDVHIIDPATGTGTFICHLLEYLFEQKKGNPHKEKVRHKYKHEIHANEVSILPYYIASLCIEKVYHQYTDDYQIFEGIVYQDTLENLFYKGNTYKEVQKQDAMFRSISQENIERQERQNKNKMTIIIGNPPYNANQQNENENNKNREYPTIDHHIKKTYIEKSSAQKTKVYDMYARFIRWATDRIQDKGIVAFVTNNSFIDSRTYDGFRKVVGEEFDHIYVVDMGGDIRKLSGKDGIWMGENHTLFGLAAAVGIAITFFVKTGRKSKAPEINYIHPLDIRAMRSEKLDYLEKTNINEIIFDEIGPKKGYWLNTQDSDFEEHIPTLSKDKKEKTIFGMSSLGVATNRDLWVYDFDEHLLQEKAKYFIHTYNELLKRYKGSAEAFQDISIKWSRDLRERYFQKKRNISNFNKKILIKSLYRPFSLKYFYSENIMNDVLTENHYKLFGPNLDKENICIFVSGNGSKNISSLASTYISELQFIQMNPVSFPLYIYENEKRRDNITDWALEEFRAYYSDHKITKLDIFHYIYAVLNDSGYTKKYEIQLKREYPRIPFYKKFQELAALGKELMGLHVRFEEVEPLEGVSIEQKAGGQKELTPKLKADIKMGAVALDHQTSIHGIPEKAYSYKLGLRSPIGWALDQHKLLKATASGLANYRTIYERFNTPQNEQKRYQNISKPLLIDLIPRLANLSLKTIEIRGKIQRTAGG